MRRSRRDDSLAHLFGVKRSLLGQRRGGHRRTDPVLKCVCWRLLVQKEAAEWRQTVHVVVVVSSASHPASIACTRFRGLADHPVFL